jgi:hypothetical protein
MRVIVTAGIASDLCAFLSSAVGAKIQIVHGDQNTPLGRLQAVTHVRQSTTNDDAHGVRQIASPHLILDVGSKHAGIRGNKAAALGIVSRQTKILFEILCKLAGCKCFSDSRLRRSNAADEL